MSGQPEFAMSLLAYEKVKGHLENGYEDNIPFSLKVMLKALIEKEV